MTLIIPAPTNYIGPKNAADLIKSIGADPADGIQAALFPGEPESAELGEEYAYAPGVKGSPVFGTFPEWGRRLMDIVLDGSGKGVKWWKVRDYARQHKVEIIPVAWQGAIMDIPEHYFEPRLGLRFWNSGPWFFPIKGSHLEDNLRVLAGFATGGA